MGRPVILKKLISRDWATGKPGNIYDLVDYKERWGSVYNMFHRVDMHAMLMDSATSAKYPGVPAVLKVNHKALDIEHEAGTVTFENGVQGQHDLVIGADGIGSQVRRTIGVIPDRKQSTSHCYHCIIATEDVKKLGLHDFTPNEAIEYWGGQDIYKIEDRLQFLESQLAEVLANQAMLTRRASHQVSELTSSASSQVFDSPKAATYIQPGPCRLAETPLPSWEVILGAAENYLKYCDCQPLPLFQRATFLRTLKGRQPEVVFSILALASRFTDTYGPCSDQARLIGGYGEAARTIVAKKVFEGTVDLSTIQ
ncbi:hypothetical protein BUE80_DR004393 [Diplocarpon rosae]|nr:hypothetical protein BUE80_DR004393 [Diplocarpon rosae]